MINEALRELDAVLATVDDDPVAAEQRLRELYRRFKDSKVETNIAVHLMSVAQKANQVLEARYIAGDKSYVDHGAGGSVFDPAKEPYELLWSPNSKPISRIAIQKFLTEEAREPKLIPGAFWRTRGQVLMNYINSPALNDFKRTVNHSLSNFLDISSVGDEFWHITRHWKRLRSPGVFSDIVEPYDAKSLGVTLQLYPTMQSEAPYLMLRQYQFYCSMLWDYAIFIDERKVIPRVAEPLYGNPYRIRRGKRLISQDLARSAIEYNTIQAACELPARPVVLEIGGGYGRLAQVFHAMGAGKVILLDIAPTLFLAKTYLHAVFPDATFFDFRPFETFEAVAREFEAADIVFLSPNQITLLPDNSIDLAININSFMEMTFEAVDTYMREIDRVCSGWLYTKQWNRERHTKKIAKLDHSFRGKQDYPVREHWTTALDRQDVIHPQFFEQVWKLG